MRRKKERKKVNDDEEWKDFALLPHFSFSVFHNLQVCSHFRKESQSVEIEKDETTVLSMDLIDNIMYVFCIYAFVGYFLMHTLLYLLSKVLQVVGLVNGILGTHIGCLKMYTHVDKNAYLCTKKNLFSFYSELSAHGLH